MFSSSKIFSFLFITFASSYLCIVSYSLLPEQEMLPFNESSYINI